MKKLTTLLFLILLIGSINLKAQENAFTSDSFGDLSFIDLTNASQTSVGTLAPFFQGMDFGPENILYGLDGTSNQLYSVDTSDASTTLIGSSTPATDHIWTGMAYDYTTGIMYATACHSIAAGSTKLYTVDVSDGSITLIGTTTDVTYFGGIAFDNTGQLYGLQLSASPSIYTIDKTDCSVTWVGDCLEFGGAGSGYGMDYNDEDETMYITAYDSFSFNSNLYSVSLVDGSATDMGFLSMWTQALAIVNPFFCDFSADETTICDGTTVNFTDASVGAVEWEWTFEGGTPATSADQNPSVEYLTGGTFNVSLTVTNLEDNSLTEVKVDYITVSEVPIQASTPVGDEGVCTGGQYNFSVDEVLYAETYEWEIEPEEAGTLEPNDNEANLTVASDWTGDFTLRTRATNMCGDGEWSENFEGTVFQSPDEFTVEGGGGYCLGGDGMEVTLSDSQSDIDYELFLDGESTGNIVAGTGDEISFGLQTEEGYYSVEGSNEYCTQPMTDQVYVQVLYPPLEPGTPAGPEVVCADETSDYEATGTDDADTYDWIIEPEEAGMLSSNGLEVTVDWNNEFAGTATLTIYGINDCGEGNPAAGLEIEVNGLPTPEVSGEELVCDNHAADYSVDDNDGSTYTWTVTGGTITDGDGTYMITVMWGDAGMGSVSVEEMTDAGCIGTSTGYEVTIDDCTAISEFGGETNILKTFPNPAGDFISIQVKGSINAAGELYIYNQMGQLVKKVKLNTGVTEQTLTVNISDLTKGIYIITSTDGDASRHQFIKK